MVESKDTASKPVEGETVAGRATSNRVVEGEAVEERAATRYQSNTR